MNLRPLLGLGSLRGTREADSADVRKTAKRV